MSNALNLLPLLQATWETIYMVFLSGLIGISFGLTLGLALFFTAQSPSQRVTYSVLGLIVNITRSIPFIILLILLIPLTNLVTGTYIGTTAAIIPLSIAAIPFYARIAESALQEVPTGLIDAVHAMGASRFQLIKKVLLPESMPGLIHGATLTIIGLIGYSAIAGAVGGGGLGELAINYGYQRFNLIVILETVTLLVILVQVLQSLGNYLAKKCSFPGIITTILVFGVISFLPFAFSQTAPEQQTVIRVGIMSGIQEDIMKEAKKIAHDRYGLNLSMIVFNDYALPNIALNDGKIDANIFQHLPFLQAQIHDRHFALVSAGKTFVYPIGFYSKRITHINQLKPHSLVVMANDPSNEARALLLLQHAGLIQLKPDSGVTASLHDIISNPKQLRFVTLDAAQLPHALSDADLVAINNDFLKVTGLILNQAIIRENKDSPYANIIVVSADNQHASWVKSLLETMHSPEVVAITEHYYPNGAAIKAW